MKIYLDDTRKAPTGWVRTKTVSRTILALKTGLVSELSLDHDLGRKETGYDVLTWIEKKIVTTSFKLPKIYIHSQNPVGSQRMKAAICSIMKKYYK